MTGDIVPGGMGWGLAIVVSPPSEAVCHPQRTSHQEGSCLALDLTPQRAVDP